MGPLDITSTVRHIGILTRLIDGFEYMGLGLCGLNYKLGLYEGMINYSQTGEFLSMAMPFPMYSLTPVESAEFSWPPGDHDRRFYWLKSQLEKYKNQLKEYGTN